MIELIVARSKNNVIGKNGENIYIAGGYGLFKEAIPMVDKMYITEVDTIIENGDVFFLEFNSEEFAFMDSAKLIRELRESICMSRKEFSEHVGIPVRTLEDWEAGRRTPPEYIPRLISYQLRYEELLRRVSVQGMEDNNLEKGVDANERS